MGTDFSNNSIKYNNNLGAPTIPTVAINIVYGSTLGEDGNILVNPILKFVISVVMVIAAVKALIDIFVAGFGGIFKGGAKSAFGSAEGIGVVGGVLALLLGVAGMGLIMTLSITFVDVIWGIIMDLLGKQSANDAFGGFVEDLDLGIFDFMKGIFTRSRLLHGYSRILHYAKICQSTYSSIWTILCVNPWFYGCQSS